MMMMRSVPLMKSAVLTKSVSCSNKIPYEIIKSILDMASPLQRNAIWYPTIDVKTGKIQNRFNRDTCNRGIIRLHHVLLFKQNNPPRFHPISVEFYISDEVTYPCVEYTLSRERHGYSYQVCEENEKKYSLSRRYIVIEKDAKLGIYDYAYLDTQYEYCGIRIVSGSRSGFIIRDDDENYDIDSINEINMCKSRYSEPWNMSTHGRMTRRYDINVWNFGYSQEFIPGSDFVQFFEEPEIYDPDFSVRSYFWTIDETDFIGGYGNRCGFERFVRYDQLEMDTLQIMW